ncbi:MAG: hypothetical protein ABIK62_00755 [candidate division WOR-3 bacterium]
MNGPPGLGSNPSDSPEDHGAADYDGNLRQLFRSPAASRLRIDGWTGLISGIASVILIGLAHRAILLSTLVLVVGVLGYLHVDRIQFPAWLVRVRRVGVCRLPWNQLPYLVAAIGAPAYLLLVNLWPMLPDSGWFRLLDAATFAMLAYIASTTFAFLVGIRRAHRAFLLSAGTKSTPD